MEKRAAEYEEELTRLSEKYPNMRSVISEITELNARLNLPKGTEHFMSDIHAEHEAFSHIKRNASGVIRRKIELLFSEMSKEERAELASIIYYPKEKLKACSHEPTELIERLIAVLSLVSDKYTRAEVISIISETASEYAGIIFELISTHHRKFEHAKNVIKAIVRLPDSEGFITAVCECIRALVIDRWHIVGDIFDRGARPDIVLDELMRERKIDIQWGNHDALWLGAAAGSHACVATALANSIAYGNLEFIESGYGISLAPLARFARIYYEDSDTSAFKTGSADNGKYPCDLLSKMYKAISILRFKLEGILIMRHPEYLMDERLVLSKINYERKIISLDGVEYSLRECDFPTVKPDIPYRLTSAERELIECLAKEFSSSKRLSAHAEFLLRVGTTYKIYNRNLLFHGCIPLDGSGEFLALPAAEGLRGRELMDMCERRVREGFNSPVGSFERERGIDFLWFLWCGKNSPLCARECIRSFERLLIDSPDAWHEEKNYYYNVWQRPDIAIKILREFSLPDNAHIINGHIPVKRGESPIKSGGRLILIDGGFCSAFRGKTGVCGYTLIYSAEGMKIAAHGAFSGKDSAIRKNCDIISETDVFEEKGRTILVRETDEGELIREKIGNLMLLLEKYKSI